MRKEVNVSLLVLSCAVKEKIFNPIPKPNRVFSSPCWLKIRELGYFLEFCCSQTDKPTRMSVRRCYAVFVHTVAPLRHLWLTRDAASLLYLSVCPWKHSQSLTPTDSWALVAVTPALFLLFLSVWLRNLHMNGGSLRVYNSRLFCCGSNMRHLPCYWRKTPAEMRK